MQAFDAAAANVLIGVARTDDAASDFGIDNRIGAWRRASVVITRLHGDVQGCARNVVEAVFLGIAQSFDFGMWHTGTMVISAPEFFAVAHDNGADHGIGVRRPARFRCFAQGFFHPIDIVHR